MEQYKLDASVRDSSKNIYETLGWITTFPELVDHRATIDHRVAVIRYVVCVIL